MNDMINTILNNIKKNDINVSVILERIKTGPVINLLSRIGSFFFVRFTW